MVQRLNSQLFGGVATATACTNVYLDGVGDLRTCSSLDLGTGRITGTRLPDAYRNPEATRPRYGTVQSDWLLQSVDQYIVSRFEGEMPACLTDYFPPASPYHREAPRAEVSDRASPPNVSVPLMDPLLDALFGPSAGVAR